MKKLIDEFKEFAFTGNVIDMAIGVIMGGAIGGVVTAVVNMLLGIISALFKVPASLNEMTAKVGTVEIAYGPVISETINFLILTFCVFTLVKAINAARALKPAEEPEPEPEPTKSDEAVLLEEIVELLKAQEK